MIFWSNYSDLTRPHPKWWFSKGNPLISGKSRLVKYYSIWPGYSELFFFMTRSLKSFRDKPWWKLEMSQTKGEISFPWIPWPISMMLDFYGGKCRWIFQSHGSQGLYKRDLFHRLSIYRYEWPWRNSMEFGLESPFFHRFTEETQLG